jgi:glyoxylase-like metal-dependent hydrolase (beta-lactamase superfamily II)
LSQTCRPYRSLVEKPRVAQFDDPNVQFSLKGGTIDQQFKIYAVRYAIREARGEAHFHDGDPGYGDPPDAPMPTDYFVWAAVSDDPTVIVDAGFTAEMAARRGRDHLHCPTEGLRELDIDCAQVPCVILTHLHYNYVGYLEKFPTATLVLQDEVDGLLDRPLREQDSFPEHGGGRGRSRPRA